MATNRRIMYLLVVCSWKRINMVCLVKNFSIQSGAAVLSSKVDILLSKLSLVQQHHRCWPTDHHQLLQFPLVGYCEMDFITGSVQVDLIPRLRIEYGMELNYTIRAGRNISKWQWSNSPFSALAIY